MSAHLDTRRRHGNYNHRQAHNAVYAIALDKRNADKPPEQSSQKDRFSRAEYRLRDLIQKAVRDQLTQGLQTERHTKRGRRPNAKCRDRSPRLEIERAGGKKECAGGETNVNDHCIATSDQHLEDNRDR